MYSVNKLNVCISSTVVLISLVSYGSHDWRIGLSIDTRATTHALKQEIYEPGPKAYLCYTNHSHVYNHLHRTPNLFAAKLSNGYTVFLSIEKEISRILELHEKPTNVSCFTRWLPLLYHCCEYSPYVAGDRNDVRIYEPSFVYNRHIVTDNFIRIEDILVGKPVMVDQRVELSITNLNGEITNVTATHRCRGDVEVDPYPEIHIYTETFNLNDEKIRQEFHWYL